MLNYTMTVLLEYIGHYNFPQCLILLLIFILHFPIMLALCLMLSMTNYVKNHAAIISGFLMLVDLTIGSYMT